jgi:hypothetical protein
MAFRNGALNIDVGPIAPVAILAPVCKKDLPTSLAMPTAPSFIFSHVDGFAGSLTTLKFPFKSDSLSGWPAGACGCDITLIVDGSKSVIFIILALMFGRLPRFYIVFRRTQ